MTDKDIKNYCKNCSVEPPAMKFKCPECKHNPDNETNFIKDIDVPSKEQVIIDTNKYFAEIIDNGGGTIGYHVVRSAELLGKIIKQNKQLAHQNQEYENLKEDYKELEQRHNGAFQDFKRLKQECEELKKRATIAEDNFACEVQARLYHQNEWLKFSKECEELKKQLKTSEKWRINAESLNEKLDIKNTRYRKALEEIKAIVKDFNDNRLCFYDDINDCQNCDMNTDCNYLRKFKILDIIRKAKGEE